MDALAFKVIGYVIVFAGLVGLVGYALMSCRRASQAASRTRANDAHPTATQVHPDLIG